MPILPSSFCKGFVCFHFALLAHVLHNFLKLPMVSQGLAALTSAQIHVFLPTEVFEVVTAQMSDSRELQQAAEET